MPRTYKNKGIHTSPETAGAKNLKGAKTTADKNNIMEDLLPVYKRGQSEEHRYNGRWSEEEFRQSVSEFFDYCHDNCIKPTQPLIMLWLGVSKAQYYEWLNNDSKYGYKSDVMRTAKLMMEGFLQSNVDKYPTGSIFLLKTQHGYVETQKVDINSTNQVNSDDIAEAIKKLGLDK